MGLVVTYYMPADATSGPWTEDLSDAVRLGTIDGIVDEAELGSVGISSLLFDDPLGTLGTSHYADGIRGLKRIWIDETACPAGDQRLFTGWFGDRRYRRGTDSLITGVARKLDATLVDSNTMLSFRVFAPVNGSNSTEYNASNSFIRPTETDLQRVTALLTVPFLSSVHDLGFIDTTGGVAMDAVDYTGQHAADVLNDCAQSSGRNFFIRYDETANEFGLHYHKPEEPIDDSMLQISNVLSDVDGVWTFAPEPDAELVRDPSRVSAAVYLPFNGSNSPAYQTRIQTEYDYGWRDSSAPSSNVKTIAKANLRATRYLLDNRNEDDRITCTVKLPAAKVTGIKQGQRLLAKFSHLPNGSNATWGDAYQWCRVLNRTVMANEQTNALYNMRLELSPLSAGCPSPTPSQTFYPLGGPGPDDSSESLPTADGHLIYNRPGIVGPVDIMPGYKGWWNFASWGAGGVGTEDRMGSCVSNSIYLITTGAGTATFHTVNHLDHNPYYVGWTLSHFVGGGETIDDSGTFLAGADITVTVPDTFPICSYHCRIIDNIASPPNPGCGGSIGFTGVDWVAAS
jgi:hypothetical protein